VGKCFDVELDPDSYADDFQNLGLMGTSAISGNLFVKIRSVFYVLSCTRDRPWPEAILDLAGSSDNSRSSGAVAAARTAACRRRRV